MILKITNPRKAIS